MLSSRMLPQPQPVQLLQVITNKTIITWTILIVIRPTWATTTTNTPWWWVVKQPPPWLPWPHQPLPTIPPRTWITRGLLVQEQPIHTVVETTYNKTGVLGVPWTIVSPSMKGQLQQQPPEFHPEVHHKTFEPRRKQKEPPSQRVPRHQPPSASPLCHPCSARRPKWPKRPPRRRLQLQWLRQQPQPPPTLLQIRQIMSATLAVAAGLVAIEVATNKIVQTRRPLRMASRPRAAIPRKSTPGWSGHISVRVSTRSCFKRQRMDWGVAKVWTCETKESYHLYCSEIDCTGVRESGSSIIYCGCCT